MEEEGEEEEEEGENEEHEKDEERRFPALMPKWPYAYKTDCGA